MVNPSPCQMTEEKSDSLWDRPEFRLARDRVSRQLLINTLPRSMGFGRVNS